MLISILLDTNNDLEQEIAHLLNEINIFIFKLKKKHNQSRSKNDWLGTISSMFFSIATVWFGLEAQSSQVIKSH